MDNGQPTTAIPLLSLPTTLPPTFETPLDARSSIALNNKEITPDEVITECEKETASRISRTEDDPIEGILKAVRYCDVEEVKRYLAAGFIQALMTYLLHFCIKEYCRIPRNKAIIRNCRPVELEIIQAILAAAEQAENKSDILNTLDKDGRSPLYLAIERGYFEVVEALIESDANVEKVSHIEETALHVAVQRPDMLKYLLDNHLHKVEKAGKSLDTRGYGPIHVAAKCDEVDSFELLINKFGVIQLITPTFDGSTALHVAAENGSTKIVEIIIQNPFAQISFKDSNGETALNRSAKHGHKAVTALLLRNGAVLSDKGPGRRTAVEQIARKFPDPIKFFKYVFDEFIIEHDSSAKCKESKVRVDYTVLTNGESGMSQMKVIEELVRCGQSELLLHPLIESLLYLKWICLRPVFYTMMVLYALFLACFNAFLVTTFYTRDYNASALSNCSNLFNETNADNCSNSFNETNVQYHKCFDVYDWIWIVLIYISIFLLLLQEIIIYIYRLRSRYWKQFETYVKLVLLALAAVVPPGVICEPADWHRHVSCAALLLSWLQATFLLSRWPDWGYYIPMFWSVAYNVLKILSMLIWLVLGFSFCFMIQYRSESPFDGPGAAFAKTLAMMSSEFDYENLFGKKHNAALDHTKFLVRLLFVIFVIFIAIVLMNVITGIAVSDIKKLNKKSNIRRLQKQVELLSLAQITFHYGMSKDIESVGKWKVDDAYEKSLTPKLQNAIINVVNRKAQRKKDDYNKNEKKNRLDVMYDTLMKLLPYLERDRQEGEVMKNKITSLEISVNELKDNMNKILATMTGNGTIRNKKSSKRSTKNQVL